MKYEPEIQNPITKEEIENLRNRIRIGDVLPVEVNKIRLEHRINGFPAAGAQMSGCRKV